MKNDHGPATTTACQGLLTRGLPVRVRAAFADESLLEESSLPKISGREPRFDWSLHCGRYYSSQEYLADEKLLDIPIESS
jgi:hypothetical protein